MSTKHCLASAKDGLCPFILYGPVLISHYDDIHAARPFMHIYMRSEDHTVDRR
jgi:hypothetical protein